MRPTDGVEGFPYDLAAFDLDGTLMRYDAIISDATLGVLEILRGRGVRVVLATGRRFEGATEHAARLGFSGEEPLVCYGGAMVRTADGETLLRRTMKPEAGVAVLRWAEERGIQSRILLEGRILASPHPTGVRETASLLAQEDVQTVASPSAWLAESGEEPIKVTLVDQPRRVSTWLDEAREAFSGRLFVTRSLPHYVEVGHPESTKSAALGLLCERWGVPTERVIAFGDGENDIDMLRFAGCGVAVGGISEAVRQAADAVTAPASEEGVARFIHKLLEEGRP